MSSICLMLLLITVSAEVPKIRWWAYRPRGLSACVDDRPGLTRFSYSGNVFGSGGSERVGGALVKDGGQWCHKDFNVQVHVGDAVHYEAVYVIDGVGNSSVGSKEITAVDIVVDYSDTPKVLSTTPISYTPPMPVMDVQMEPVKRVSFITATKVAWTNYWSPITTTTTTTETPMIPNQESYEVPVCDESSARIEQLESLLNDIKRTKDRQQAELIELRANLGEWRADYDTLMRVLERSAMADDNWLLLSTKNGTLPEDEETELVRDVIRDKLDLSLGEFKIKSTAERCSEGIRFEMVSYRQKLQLLVFAEKKLARSKFVLSDYHPHERGKN